MKRNHIAALIFIAIVSPIGSATAQLARHASLPWPSPDGQRIAFASSREGKSGVYTMKLDGTDVQRVTTAETSDQGPVFSPDGKVIAFFSMSKVFGSAVDQKAMFNANVVKPDGTGRRIVAHSFRPPWIRFAPDGRLIFGGADSLDNAQIVTVNRDGSDWHVVQTGLSKPADPIVSPDGKTLVVAEIVGAMTENTNPATLKTNIYALPISGGNARLVSTFDGYIQLPTWSPDGKTIAYQTFTGRKGIADIVALDLESGKFRTLTTRDRPFLDETPAYLPDGRILFQSTRDGSYEIYMMDGDGKNQRRISM